MKIEKLGIGKIKVTVSHTELDTWNINPGAISPDSPQLKEFIGSMIARSAGETGIELSGSNVLVEARPQGDDFVFIITTVGSDTDKMHREILKTIKRQKLINGEYKAAAKTESTHTYYSFDTLAGFADMLGCAGCDVFENTTLYRGDKIYLLAIEKTHPFYDRCCAILSEHAKRLPDRLGDIYTGERARVFAESGDYDAIMRSYI